MSSERSAPSPSAVSVFDPRSALEVLPVAVLLTDLKERVLFANPRAAALLGRRAEECVGHALARWVQLPRSLRELAANFEQASAHPVTLASPLGEHVPTTLSVGVLRAPSGDATGFACVLRTSLDASSESAGGLPHLERLIAMGQMVAGFAHEVRNPLAALKSLAEDELALGGDEGPRSEHMARIVRLIHRIEALVRSSLQFGSPGAPQPGGHEVRALVYAALEMLSPRVRAAGAEGLAVTFEPALPLVYVDDTQLVQVLVALLGNALDAALDPRLVALRARRGEGEALVIEVEDRGPGIAPEVLPHIFDPFFTTKPRGTGLGLAIAQRLVRENRGQIHVRARPGEGTCFSVELPTTVGP